MQDSTPIIERMEAAHPEPSIHPARSGARLRLRADRGVRRRVGQQADVPLPLVLRGGPGVGGRAHRAQHEPGRHRRAGSRASAPAVKGRMVPRLAFVGSSPATKDQIEASFRRQVAILERHLDGAVRILFGGRPAFGDFGLYAQLYECFTDPTPGRDHPRTGAARAGVDRAHARPGGRRATSSAGRRSSRRCCRCCATRSRAVFFPWSLANAAALAAGAKEFTVDARRQAVQRRSRRSTTPSRSPRCARATRAVADRAALDPMLERASCRTWLSG